jgi:hypothetical protein
MDDEHTSFVSGRLRKYGGLFAALTAVMNLSLGGFLMYAWTTTMANHVCNRQVPLWVLVSACTSLAYGGLFALYALYALVTFLRQRGYQELETSETLSEAAKPSGFFLLTGIALVLVYLFRLSWLIFGTVEVVQASAQQCNRFLLQSAFVYMVLQWALIGGFFVLAIGTCCILICCAALLTKG